MYDETKQEWVTRDEVPVILTYGADGTPVAVLNGKKREREKDMVLLRDWLREMFKKTGVDVG